MPLHGYATNEVLGSLESRNGTGLTRKEDNISIATVFIALVRRGEEVLRPDKHFSYSDARWFLALCIRSERHSIGSSTLLSLSFKSVLNSGSQYTGEWSRSWEGHRNLERVCVTGAGA